MTKILGTLPRTLLITVLTAALCLALLSLSAGLAKAEQMVASWYGPGFEGAMTASGEPFDPNDYTAAHKTLPFGTKLVVTYNGHSVVVRINDRGPYVAGRDIDLSQAAAQYIGLTSVGEATVNVSTAEPATPTGPYSANAAPEEPARTPAPAPRATAGAALVAQRGAGEEQYVEQAGLDQYAQARGAAETAPAAPPPVPDPTRIETPPAELATPGSTVERRAALFAGAPAETPAPSPEPPAEEVAGITVLPDTGGSQLWMLAGGAFLVGAGGLLVRTVRS